MNDHVDDYARGALVEWRPFMDRFDIALPADLRARFENARTGQRDADAEFAAASRAVSQYVGERLKSV